MAEVEDNSLRVTAEDLREMTDWPDALVEDYLEMTRAISAITNVINITVQEVSSDVLEISSLRSIVNRLERSQQNLLQGLAAQVDYLPKINSLGRGQSNLYELFSSLDNQLSRITTRVRAAADDSLAEVLVKGNITGGTDLVVTSGDSIAGAGAINITGTAATGALTVTGEGAMDQLNVAAPIVPLNTPAAGTAGDVAWSSGFIYICVATDTWQRVAMSVWTIVTAADLSTYSVGNDVRNSTGVSFLVSANVKNSTGTDFRIF